MDDIGKILEIAKLSATALAEREAQAAGISIDEAEEAQRRKVAEWRAAEVAEQRMRAILASGIPVSREGARSIADGKHEPTEAARTCVRFLGQQKHKILILSGSLGTGKTFGAACAVAHVQRGKFVRSRELAVAMNPISDTRLRAESERLVVLDDLGLENHEDPRWSNAWFEFVDRRQFTGHTIITTNVPGRDLWKRYDPRVIDRLGACCALITIKGASLRRKPGVKS